MRILRHHCASIATLVALVALFATLGCERRSKSKTEHMKDNYFVRCARYEMTGEHVMVVDPKSPRVITLDPWLEVIFAAADGQRTTQQFIEKLKTQYPGGAPAGLEEQTLQLMEKLLAEGLIRLTDQPTQLPYYLSMPVAQQDKERALAEMKKDGYIK
jgi:Coenzyme PQQ synthesis protein D (PqqD)